MNSCYICAVNKGNTQRAVYPDVGEVVDRVGGGLVDGDDGGIPHRLHRLHVVLLHLHHNKIHKGNALIFPPPLLLPGR
jgi:hypothetical protein